MYIPVCGVPFHVEMVLLSLEVKEVLANLFLLSISGRRHRKLLAKSGRVISSTHSQRLFPSSCLCEWERKFVLQTKSTTRIRSTLCPNHKVFPVTKRSSLSRINSPVIASVVVSSHCPVLWSHIIILFLFVVLSSTHKKATLPSDNSMTKVMDVTGSQTCPDRGTKRCPGWVTRSGHLFVTPGHV